MTKDHGSRPKEAVPTEQTDKPRLDVSRIKEAHPVDDDTALVPFGWAPGGYIGVCNRCGDTHGGCEKRAPRCQECAEFLRDNSPVPTESPVVAGSMLEKMARVIVEASGVRAYGLYDYSAYPEMLNGLKRHVVRDELTRNSQVVFESNNPSEARQWYDAACRRFVARAALQAIREPSREMVVKAMSSADRSSRARFTAMIDAILSGEA